MKAQITRVNYQELRSRYDAARGPERAKALAVLADFAESVGDHAIAARFRESVNSGAYDREPAPMPRGVAGAIRRADEVSAAATRKRHARRFGR